MKSYQYIYSWTLSEMLHFSSFCFYCILSIRVRHGVYVCTRHPCIKRIYTHMCISSHMCTNQGWFSLTDMTTQLHTHTHSHKSLKHDSKVGFVPAGFSFTAQHNATSPKLSPPPHNTHTRTHTPLLIGYYLGCRSLCWYLMKGHGCHFSADGHHGYREKGWRWVVDNVGGAVLDRIKDSRWEVMGCQSQIWLIYFLLLVWERFNICYDNMMKKSLCEPSCKLYFGP